MARTIPTPESGFGNIYIDSLIGDHDGAKWDVASGPVTYSFETSPAWTDAQKAMFRAVLDSYAAVCDLTFSEVDFSTRANLVEQKRYSLPNASAWHQTPLIDEYPTLYGQFTGLDNPYTGLANPWIWPGSVDYSSVVHEIGHAMNLAHPHDGGWGKGRTIFPGATNSRYLGDDAMNQGIWTVMSYIRGRAGHYGHLLPEPVYFVGDVITPMALDVAALQAMYGVNTAWRTGDDVYQLVSTNGPGTGWSCIWDAGGNDTISNAGMNRDCTINLMDAPLVGPHAGGYVSWNKLIIGGFTIAHGAVIENAIGGSGNDTITGNHAHNVLQGGDGNDVLAGGAGHDTINGGAGVDKAVFTGSRIDYAITYADGTYTVTGADGADQVSEVETFVFSDGSFNPAELVNAAPVGRVTISGTPRHGQILSAAHTLTDADGLGAISYQWQADGVNIANATRAVLGLGAAQVGAAISVVASYVDGRGVAEKMASAATQDVAASEMFMRTTVHSGTSFDEWISGTSGNDKIKGRGGADTLSGKGGDDTITAGAGNDAVDGGDGNDLIVQEFLGYDAIVGGDGMDTVDYRAAYATGASVWFDLGTGTVKKYQHDKLVGLDSLSSIEAVIGTIYHDVLIGSTRSEILSGAAGNDTLNGDSGNDTINGGSGNDQLAGDGGDDILNGGAGDDFLSAVAGSDVVNGGAGNDTLGDAGGSHLYVLEGSFGRDTLQAIEHRTNPGDAAVVQFAGITPGNLFFQREGDDLRITVAGKTDSLCIVEWYDQARDASGRFHLQVDSFKVGNDLLAASVVDDLVTVIGAAPVSMSSLLA